MSIPPPSGGPGTGADPFDLTDRVAVVTGGSRGLGREVALALAAHGATVVVASRKADACARTAAEVEEATGRSAHGIACHVGRWEDCDALLDEVVERLGGIDVLVNNAGMSPLYPSLPEVTEALFDKVVDVNLKGPFRLAVLAGTRMAAGRGGSIVNVSSTAAVEPQPGELPYAAAKAGLNTLTLGLARSFGPTVRVNAVMPGPFLTDVSAAWDPDELASRVAAYPLQRAGQPHEIVGAALYLASDASSFTTGTVLKVDGGAAYAPA